LDNRKSILSINLEHSPESRALDQNRVLRRVGTSGEPSPCASGHKINLEFPTDSNDSRNLGRRRRKNHCQRTPRLKREAIALVGEELSLPGETILGADDVSEPVQKGRRGHRGISLLARHRAGG
jgi:hypothetical protein